VCFHTDRHILGNENNNSIGLRVVHRNVSILLTGDSEPPLHRWWTLHISRALYVNCDILKVPHHGRANGLNGEWLDAVNPQLAVISVGSRNRYGHPNGKVLSMLRDAAVPIKRTDKDGTVSIVSDGKSWQLDNEVHLARGPPVVAASPDPNRDLGVADLPATKDSASEDAVEEIIVYVTRTGRKYHTRSCRYGKRSTRPLTLEQARANYEPCKICKPYFEEP